MNNNPVRRGDLPQGYAFMIDLSADFQTRLLSQASGMLGLCPRQIERRRLVRVTRITLNRQFSCTCVSFDGLFEFADAGL